MILIPVFCAGYMFGIIIHNIKTMVGQSGMTLD